MVHTNTLPFESAVEETRPTAKGAPARCPAYAPHSASCRRVACSRLRILRALRPPTCIQDRANRFFRQGFISELANSTLGADEFGDRHARVPPSWLQPTIKAEAYSAISNRPSHCITMQLHVMNAPVLPKNVHLKIS